MADKSLRKLGANRHDRALKQRKHDRNFAQSRDIWEDRGERQIKNERPESLRRGIE